MFNDKLVLKKAVTGFVSIIVMGSLLLAHCVTASAQNPHHDSSNNNDNNHWVRKGTITYYKDGDDAPLDPVLARAGVVQASGNSNPVTDVYSADTAALGIMFNPSKKVNEAVLQKIQFIIHYKIYGAASSEISWLDAILYDTYGMAIARFYRGNAAGEKVKIDSFELNSKAVSSHYTISLPAISIGKGFTSFTLPSASYTPSEVGTIAKYYPSEDNVGDYTIPISIYRNAHDGEHTVDVCYLPFSAQTGAVAYAPIASSHASAFAKIQYKLIGDLHQYNQSDQTNYTTVNLKSAFVFNSWN